MLGGRVTLISQCVGVDLSNTKPKSCNVHLDINKLVDLSMLNFLNESYMWCYGFEQFYMILLRPGGFRWLDGFDVFVSPGDIHVDKYSFFKTSTVS